MLFPGSSPQVTKGTKVVLPFRLTQREFTRIPNNWDVRLHQQDGLIITLQVKSQLFTLFHDRHSLRQRNEERKFVFEQIHIPPNALVGLWRCMIETTTSTPGSRVEEFRCKDDVYVLFNPFCRGNVENDYYD